MNKIKKLTLTLAITTILAVLIIPSCYAATGTITVDTLRVRKAPSTSSDVLRNLDQGDKVDVIEKKDDWYKVKLSDGQEAYVYAEYVKLEEDIATNEGQKEEETGEKTEIELQKNTRMYILPLLFSSEIGKVEETITVKVVEKINNWICVEYNGISGWVLSSNRTANNEEPSNETPINTPTENKKGYVNVTSAFVRKEPSKTAEIMDSLYLNNEITILKEVDGWYEIRLGDKTGYVFAELISDSKTGTSSRGNVTRTANTQLKDNTETTKTETTEEKVIKTAYVSGTAVNVRQQASTSSAIVTTLKQKAKIDILEDLSGWYKIKTTNGVGYISKQYITDSLDKIVVKKPVNTTTKTETSATGSASATAQDVVNFARKYVGYKYVYGGSGPTSFDCSGFTMYVFKQFGVSLPHNARTQSNYGKYVNKANLQPGDLLIFNDYANKSIGHAGIYIGGGKFVHAANSNRGVTTDTINSGYYSIRFVEGRRLV